MSLQSNQVLKRVMRFTSNLINEMHGFQHQAEPDAEKALRNSITKYQLQHRSDIEQMIADAVANETGNLIAQIQQAICEGMNIECEPEASLKDLFALIDTSISSRIKRSEELNGEGAAWRQ